MHSGGTTNLAFQSICLFEFQEYTRIRVRVIEHCLVKEGPRHMSLLYAHGQTGNSQQEGKGKMLATYLLFHKPRVSI